MSFCRSASSSASERPPAFIGKAPRVYDAVIARELGDTAADTLQQIIWCLHWSGVWVDGEWWVRLPHKELRRRLFYKNSESTLQRNLNDLKDAGFIRSRQDLNKHGHDRTNWYTVHEQRIYEAFWPDDPKPDPEAPRQDVILTPPMEEAEPGPPAAEPDPEAPGQVINLNPSPQPCGQNDYMPIGGSQALAPNCQNEPGFKMTPPLRDLKKRDLKDRSDTESRTDERTRSALFEMSFGFEDEEAAAEPAAEPLDGDLMFTCNSDPEWLASDPGWLADEPPAEAGPIDPADCPHPDTSRSYFNRLPDMSFQCGYCRATVWDPNTRTRAAPKTPPKLRPDGREPAMRLACFKLFDDNDMPMPPGHGEYVSPCDRHGRMEVIYDELGFVIGCKQCDWKPPEEAVLPVAWRDAS